MMLDAASGAEVEAMVSGDTAVKDHAVELEAPGD